MSAPCTILDGAYHSLGLRDVFACTTHIELWECGTEGFKLVIDKDGDQTETTMMVKFPNAAEFL